MSTAREDMMAEYGEARRKHASRQAERDELFQLMLGRTTTKAVERILAAGYRKPQQVTTVEELDALPVRSVLLTYGNRFGPLAVQKLSDDEPAGLDYLSVGMAMGYSAAELHLPATVLHVGGAE